MLQFCSLTTKAHKRTQKAQEGFGQGGALDPVLFFGIVSERSGLADLYWFWLLCLLCFLYLFVAMVLEVSDAKRILNSVGDDRCGERAGFQFAG